MNKGTLAREKTHLLRVLERTVSQMREERERRRMRRLRRGQ